MKSFAQRSVTALAIAGLTLGMGALGVVNSAAEDSAQGGTGSTIAPASVIDFAATGSITINKSTDPQGGRDTGNAGYTPQNPTEGVTFELRKIQDITSAAEFEAASKLTVATAGEGTLVGTQSTPANGVIKFENLNVGLYLVKEIAAPDGIVMGAPYLVYIPMTNPENTSEWNYDVVTNPKNAEAETPVKEVKDADANVGDEITYTITSPIPSVDNHEVSLYRVSDDLDEDNLKTEADKVTVELSDGTALTVDNDYTVTVNATTQEVNVEFLSTGLSKLTAAKKADANAKVVTTIKAEVLEIANNDGEAENEARVFYNNPLDSSDTTPIETPTNKVTSYWAKLRVLKNDADNKNALEGAEFEVYQCEDKDTLGDKITIGGQDKWTTGADGTLVVDGLHVTDIEDGDVTIDKTYCLVETKAPNGYELLTEPVEVKINSGDLEQLGDDAYLVSHQVEIPNIPSNQPKLPMTGGEGIGLIAAAGILIVGAGAVAAKRNGSKA